jgi:soluble epoxide hydrolase / lipid-phosphate phosphatase
MILQDAPKVPPHDISLYSSKRAADDIAQLAAQLGVDKIILGGHVSADAHPQPRFLEANADAHPKDWGGMIVFRVALWYPALVSHIFSICTPYTPPSKTFRSTEDIVKAVPQFAYQLHLAGDEVEQALQTPDQIRQFLLGLYGARGPNGEMPFDPTRGVLLENLPKLEPPSLLGDQVSFLEFQLPLLGGAAGRRICCALHLL